MLSESADTPGTDAPTATLYRRVARSDDAGIDCDETTARERLAAAGLDSRPGTPTTSAGAPSGGAPAVAYDGKVVVQGSRPTTCRAAPAERRSRARLLRRREPGEPRTRRGRLRAGQRQRDRHGGSKSCNGDRQPAECRRSSARLKSHAIPESTMSYRGDSERSSSWPPGECVEDPELREHRVRVRERPGPTLSLARRARSAGDKRPCRRTS